MTSPYTYLWNTVPGKTTASITGLAAGIYTVKVTDKMGCNKNATVVLVATKVINNRLQTVSGLEASVSPNPVVDGKFSLQVSSETTGNVAVKMMDVTGRVVLTDVMNLTVGENSKQINASHLPKGMYMIVVSIADKSKTIRLIIQ